MSFEGREIERKLVASSSKLSFFEAEVLVSNYIAFGTTGLEITRVEEGGSYDWYWGVPGANRKFARVRAYESGLHQLTVKTEDRNGTLNRVEIDLITSSPLHEIRAHHTELFGPEAGCVEKRYTVYWLNRSSHQTISIYEVKVNGDIKQSTFIEIEGTDEEWVNQHTEGLKKRCCDLEDAKGSLYSLFLEKQPEDIYYAPI